MSTLQPTSGVKTDTAVTNQNTTQMADTTTTTEEVVDSVCPYINPL